MTHRTFLAAICVAVCVLSFASIVSGADWLGTPLFHAFPLPLGNLLTGTFYVSLAALPVLASRPGTPSRVVAWLLLAAAVLWLPISIGLAGNLELNFSSWPGELWVWYSLAVLPGGSLLSLLFRLILCVHHRWKRAANPDPPAFVAGNRS